MTFAIPKKDSVRVTICRPSVARMWPRSLYRSIASKVHSNPKESVSKPLAFDTGLYRTFSYHVQAVSCALICCRLPSKLSCVYSLSSSEVERSM